MSAPYFDNLPTKCHVNVSLFKWPLKKWLMAKFPHAQHDGFCEPECVCVWKGE